MLRLSIGPVWWALALLALWAAWAQAVCTTAQLTSEFSTDPAALGYAPLITAANDAGVQELINRIRAAPETGYRVWRTPIPSYEFVNAYDPTEYAALPADKIAQLNGVVGAGRVDPQAPNTGSIIRNIFPVGGVTRTNLTAIAKVDGSRYQVLCLNGTTGGSATLDEVSKALGPLRP